MKMLRNTAKAAAVAVAGLFATLAPSGPAVAQNGNPFIGQMTYWAGNFAPRGWAFCNGQLLQIAQNTALFSILGTTYGGDGRTTFGLPDMRGRLLVHAGRGPGLTTRQMGERYGSETNTLNVLQLPSHNHTGGAAKATSAASNTTSANGAALATGGAYAGRAPLDQDMAAGSVAIDNTGSNQPVNNIQPSLAVSCIIALEGVYPSRS